MDARNGVVAEVERRDVRENVGQAVELAQGREVVVGER